MIKKSCCENSYNTFVLTDLAKDIKGWYSCWLRSYSMLCFCGRSGSYGGCFGQCVKDSDYRVMWLG